MGMNQSSILILIIIRNLGLRKKSMETLYPYVQVNLKVTLMMKAKQY